MRTHQSYQESKSKVVCFPMDVWPDEQQENSWSCFTRERVEWRFPLPILTSYSFSLPSPLPLWLCMIRSVLNGKKWKCKMPNEFPCVSQVFIMVTKYLRRKTQMIYSGLWLQEFQPFVTWFIAMGLWWDRIIDKIFREHNRAVHLMMARKEGEK